MAPASLEPDFPPQSKRENADREHAESARDRGEHAGESQLETREEGHNHRADDHKQPGTAEGRHADGGYRRSRTRASASL